MRVLAVAVAVAPVLSDLRAWIERRTVPLPGTQQDPVRLELDGGVVVDLTGGTCTGMQVESVQAPPQDTNDLAFALEAALAAASCDVLATLVKMPLVPTPLAMQVHLVLQGTRVRAAAALPLAQGLPTGLEVRHCDITPGIADVHVKASGATGWLLGHVSSLLKSGANSMLGPQVCGKAAKDAQALGPQVQKAAQQLAQVAATPARELPHVDQALAGLDSPLPFAANALLAQQLHFGDPQKMTQKLAALLQAAGVQAKPLPFAANIDLDEVRILGLKHRVGLNLTLEGEAALTRAAARGAQVALAPRTAQGWLGAEARAAAGASFQLVDTRGDEPSYGGRLSVSARGAVNASGVVAAALRADRLGQPLDQVVQAPLWLLLDQKDGSGNAGLEALSLGMDLAGGLEVVAGPPGSLEQELVLAIRSWTTAAYATLGPVGLQAAAAVLREQLDAQLALLVAAQAPPPPSTMPEGAGTIAAPFLAAAGLAALVALPLLRPWALGWRHGVALGCVVVSGALTASMCIQGSDVNVYLTHGGATTVVQVLNWSLVTTLQAAWNSGVYPLFLVAGTCSLVLPVLKNAVVLVVALLSDKQLAPAAKERILVAFCCCGKLSLVAAFFLVLAMRILGTGWQGEDAALKLQMENGAGIVLVLAASFVSLKLAHLVLFQHWRDQGLLRPKAWRGSLDAGTTLGSWKFGLAAGMVAALGAAGLALPALEIHMGGAFGLAYDVLDKDRHVVLTPLDLLLTTLGLPAPPGGPVWQNAFWRVFTTVSACAFGVAAPLLLLVSSTLLWTLNLQLRPRFVLHCAVQMLRACAALDVLGLVLYLAAWQAGPFVAAVLAADKQGVQSICVASAKAGLPCADLAVQVGWGTHACAVAGILTTLLASKALAASRRVLAPLAPLAPELQKPLQDALSAASTSGAS